jgi:hypothetical protein
MIGIRTYLLGVVRLLWSQVRPIVDFGKYLASFLRSPHQLLRSWPEGDIALGPLVALFVHFDRRGRVRPYVLQYVAALQQCGFSVVFVTNSGRLRDDSVAALRKLCACILIRRNIGYDFAAWREGLDFLRLPRDNTDMVLIANDSVYGPLRPLDPILAQIDFDRADIWGATESWQTRYHLQSYFLIAGRKALTSEAWRTFWRTVRPVQSKHWVIRHYEVGLTQALIRGGMRCAAIWRYTELIGNVEPSLIGRAGDGDALANDPSLTARRSHAGRIRQGAVARRPLNPTSDLWRQLLLAGYPFLKRELLRENPTGVLDIAEWRDEVKDKLGSETELIDADLKEVLRNRAP